MQFTTATDYRAQFESMTVVALETLITNLQAKIDSQNVMGRCFAGLGPSIAGYGEIQGIVREVLAAREAQIESMVEGAFDDDECEEGDFSEIEEAMADAAAEGAASEAQEAAEDARQEAEFDAEMEHFQNQIDDEEVAEVARQARELAAEEEATAQLRWLWENGMAA